MVLCVKTSIRIGMQLALIAALGGRARPAQNANIAPDIRLDIGDAHIDQLLGGIQ